MLSAVFSQQSNGALSPTGSVVASLQSSGSSKVALPMKFSEPVAYSVSEEKRMIMAAAAIEPYSNQYFFTCAVGGLLSCGLTHLAVTPLDLVKCNMQANPKNYPNLVTGFKFLFSKESGISAFRGWSPTLVGYSIQGIFKFGFYEYFKWKFAKAVGEDNASKYRSIVFASASASAEVIADIAFCPFESIKVRVQTDAAYADTKGLLDGGARILKNDGFNGFYKSLTPLWARQVPYTVIKFVAFEKVVEIIYGMLPKAKNEYSKTQQLGVTFLAGYIAGIFCAIVSHPADTMVSKLSKLKVGVDIKSTGDGVSKIYAEIGFNGLWRGLVARIIMIGTLTGLQWFIYDSYKVYTGLPTTGGPVKK